MDDRAKWLKEEEKPQVYYSKLLTLITMVEKKNVYKDVNV